ncbi:tripartite tricarboxylate transporter substrate binding protein [Variovorax paradoxus]|nr:tripartite tricarboxylate transporter substrate binding protein [Variovorax paradoxus]MBT2304843.1 tripartite tricarboxylate transporter substrate binding protein [Variovorax paradoxus]
MYNVNRRTILAAAGATALATSKLAWAQAPWKPVQPIRIVVPFSAGGGSDVVARLIAQGFSEALGQPVVVDNKAGASGAIGSDYVYSAASDGYTLLLGTGDSQAMNPHVNKVRFETLKFTPVGGIAKFPFVLVGRPGLPATNVSELVQLARQTSLTYSSSGPGAAPHIQMNMFAEAAKINNLLHVPYQGAAPAFQALLAGQVDLFMAPINLTLQYRDKLRFFGVASLERNDALAEVPTLVERGFNVDADSFVCLLAPPGTPDAIATVLGEKLRTVVSSPAIDKKLRELGTNPYRGTRAEFATFYQNEYARWGKAIRGLKL